MARFNHGVVFDHVQEGDTLPECRITMHGERYFAYNKLVNEINPLHFDREYAGKLGYRDIVVAGVYTFSFIPKMIENWVGESGRIRSIDIRFQSPVYIEDTIIHTAYVKEKYSGDDARYIKCQVSAHNTEGHCVTSALVSVSFS